MNLKTCLFALWLLIATSCFADTTKPRRWEPIRSFDYWALGALSGASLATTQIFNTGNGQWGNGILFDDAARNAFRASGKTGRDRAARFSDITLGLVIASPFVLDAAVLQWWQGKDLDGAARTAVIGAQSVLFTVFTSELVKRTINRRRPFQDECGADPNYASGCGKSDAYRSFFSGHASMAFTGAGLLCLNHSKLNLFNGNETADKLACAGGLAVAATTGLLRVIADRHYTTDVLVGSLVGFFSGYFLPSLFHNPEENKEVEGAFMILPTGLSSAALVRTMRF